MENNISMIESPSDMEDEIIKNINPNVSQEMTMDGSYAIGYRSPSISLYNNGISSPSQGRSVREFEEQMSALRKENFNLKLRIYVLEEKLPVLDQINSPTGQESLMKQYLENKVETEILKNDLEEKKQILREAAEAINHLENIQKETDERNFQITEELKHRIHYLEYEYKLLEKNGKCSSINEENLKAHIGNSEIENSNILKVQDETSIKNSEEKISEFQNQIKKLEEIILNKNQTIKEYKDYIEDLQFKNSELKDTVEMQDKSLNTSDLKKLQNDSDKLRSELADKICELDELQEKFTKKNEDCEKALKYIEKLLKVTSLMQTEIDQLKKDTDNKENESNISNESTSKTVTINKKLQNKIELLSNQLKAMTVEAQNKNSLVDKLKTEMKEVRNETERAHEWSRECNNICNVLTIRLEELAGFLDTLLQHKDILNALAPERKREIQNAVNKSLDLSRSLTAKSLSISNLSFNESNLAQLSNITGILENSHSSKCYEKDNTCDVKNEIISGLKSKLESFREKYNTENKKDTEKHKNSLSLKRLEKSESEEWSEPDRNVSSARIGLSNSTKLTISKGKNDNIQTSETTSSLQSNDEKNKSRTKHYDKIVQYEKMISDKDNRILEIQCQLVEVDNHLKKKNILLIEATSGLEEKEKKIQALELELDTFKSQQNDINTLIKLNEEKLHQEFEIKNDELRKLEEEKNLLIAKLKESEIYIVDLKKQTEELSHKYEEDIRNIKENEFIQLEEMSQEFRNKLNENLNELELKHQQTLKENWVSRTKYTELSEQTNIIQLELENLKESEAKLKESEADLKEQLDQHKKITQTTQKNLDENLLLMSKTTLERTKILNEKLNLEKYIQELMKNCESLRNENNILINQIKGFIEDKPNDCPELKEKSNQNSDDNQRFEITSSDLGIESDTGHTSDPNKVENKEKKGIEENEKENKENKTTDQQIKLVVSETQIENNSDKLPSDHKCHDIYKDNLKLRNNNRRLTRWCREMLKDVRKTHENMEQFEHNVKVQIQKTNIVLEYARNNFSNKKSYCDNQK